ncbi:MAG: hypothetical protein SFW67_27085 [Myxococcaceae bacterium]|nr:hypothetical protein [Myxococcaceae bacterium]
MKWLLLTVVLSGCATIDTAGLSEACRRLYDACLSACPGVAPGSIPVSPGPNTQIEIASCTQDCNDRAKACR